MSFNPSRAAADEQDVEAATVWRIVRATNAMPFSGLVRVPAPLHPKDGIVTAEFVIELAGWLEAYKATIAAQADSFTTAAAKIAKLENERAVVRSFFGLADPDSDVDR